MKRLLSLLIILLAAGAALYFAQHREARDAVSANAVVDVAADLQRDVTRVPMRVTRLSDADEMRIGDELARRYGLSTAPQTPEMSSAQDYINRVGARVAAHARRKLVFHFYLDPNPDLINAFALPGGHVVIGLGLINRLVQLDREYVIRADTPTGELSQLAIEGLMGYFRSHPLASERLARVKALIIEEHLSPNQPITLLQTGRQIYPKYQP
jgi:predicted Zn-dependent protease